jgi:endonuclease/exonuclease/phosphatase family metal-dependent hydrolase
MKVMTFNLRVDVPIDGVHYWPNRIPLVVETIQKTKPAILALQEVSDRMANDLFPLLSDYEARGVGRNHDLTGERASILFLKDTFSCIREETFWLSDTPYLAGSMDEEDGFPRICTMIELKNLETQSIIRVMNVHFSYRSVRNRDQNTSTLLMFYAKYEQEQTLPTIMLGDFNAEMNDPLHGRIQQTGFIDAVSSLKQKRLNTYHEFKGFPGLTAIDFIYGNQAIQFLSHTIIQEEKVRHYASDHYPVLVELLINL